jgi:hypothetical protein
MYIDFQEKMFPGIKGFNHSSVRDQEDLDKNIEANMCDQTTKVLEFTRQEKIYLTY